jgi:hypothetical protein
VINAYAAASNGKLTPVSGSPFKDDVTNMAVNGKYLLGSTRSGLYVAAFQMQSNGALQWTYSTGLKQYNSSGCLYPNPLVLDHTGTNLYVSITTGSDCDSTAYQSFIVDKSNGRLQFLGTSGSTFLYSDPFSFDNRNKFAYGSACINYQGNYLDTFTALERDSYGFVTTTGIPQPSPNENGLFYCATGAAADPFGHVALGLQGIQQGDTPVGLPRIASYTESSSGSLSTNTPITKMPVTQVGDGTSITLSMSPSGALLAVTGDGGLEIFHFNGPLPATQFTGLLTKDGISQAFWDNANHLYAISNSAQKLYVYTATPTGVSQAAGSPYTIAKPANIIVQPKTSAPTH